LSGFGLLQGAGTINKTGPGTIYTYTNSTFTGIINLSEGLLVPGTGVIQALTTSAGTINVNAASGTTAGFAINGAAASATFPATLNINSDASFQYPGNTGTLTMSGSMALGASTRTLTVNGTTAFSGPITGTAGFTKAGAATATLTTSAKAISTSTPGSSVAITQGNLWLNAENTAGTSNLLPSVTAVSISAGCNYTFWHNENTSFNNGATFTGAGQVEIYGPSTWTGAGIVFASGQLAGFSGTLSMSANQSAHRNRAIATVNDLPAGVAFNFGSGASAAHSITLNLSNGVGGQTYPTLIRVDYYLFPNLATATLNANQPATGSNGITLQGGIYNSTPSYGSVGGITFRLGGTNTDNNIISGKIYENLADRIIGITKQDAGRWVLSSNLSSYRGVTTVSVSGGTLVAAATSALGGTGAVTINTAGTLEIASTTVTKASSQVTVGGLGDGNNGAIRSQSGTNTFTAANFVLSAATRIQADAGRLTLASAGAVSGAFAIEKTGAGDVALSQTNSTYTGTTTVSTGKLVASKLANVGAVSSLGQPALANATITMAPGTTLAHEGTTADTTDRIIALNAVGTMTIESSGTGVGAVTLSGGSFTLPNGLNTIAFSGINSADNTCARTIADTTSATAVSKSGSNKWILSGALTHTGTTSCAAGTLNFGSTNRSISSPIAISGGTIENSTNTLATSGGVTMTGGTITAEIASTTTVTVNSGTTARLEPTNSANSYTGATAINASGKLEVVTDVDPEAPAAGKVLGNSAVTVGNGGEIITSANANQRGQMRYGGNLTFNSGAILRIGFAA
jgi:autotransporter-associated beta strand protein